MKPSFIVIFLFLFFCFQQSIFAQKEIELINSGEILKEGLKYNDAGKYDEAIEQYEKIGRNDTNYATAIYEEAYSAYNEGKYDTVFRLAKKLMDMDSYVGSEAYTLYGNALDDQDKSKEAIEFYTMAISKFPKSYLLHFNLGVSYFKAVQYDEAYKCFKRALEINPRHPTSHYFLGLMLADSKRWAPAMLAFNTALLLGPNKNVENKSIAFLLSIAKGEYTPVNEKGKLSEPEDPNFAKIDKLIESKVALNEGYEIAAKMDDKMMKQNQFLLETMKKSKPVSDNYFVKMYVPVYSDLMATQSLKTFEYYPYKDIDNEIVTKWKSKSKKDITEYETWISAYFDKTYANFVDTVNGKPVTFKRYSYNNGNIEALGTDFDTKTKQLKGHWRYFHPNSNLQREGEYDNSGKAQGEWKYYYANGAIKTILTFKDDKKNGRQRDYYMNGNLKRDAPFKDDKYDGKVLEYYNNGGLQSENDYTSNITNGKVRTYFQNGNPNLDIDAKNDKIDGKIVQYDVHGYISMTSDAKDGEKNGQYVTYYANGNVKTKGNVKAGVGDGKWTYYDEQGKQVKECEFIKGVQVGNVKEYYSNGKLSTDETYDSKGKLTGLATNYDDDGVKYFEGTYKDDKLVNYKYFDKTGKVLQDASESHGELPFKSYTVFGKLIKEGVFKKGERQGKWTYYYRNGVVRMTENYDNGIQTGDFQEFYKSGILHKEGSYKNGKLSGHYLTYFENGKLQEEFILVDGLRQGDTYTYYLNGKVSDHSYYTDGDETGWQANYYPDGKLNYEYFEDDALLSKYFVYDTAGKVASKFLNNTGTAVFALNYFNGKQKFSGNYKNGHLEGTYKYYYGNGLVDGESNYSHGYRNGAAKEYYMNGKIMKDAWYKNGEGDSTWTVYERDGTKDNVGAYKNDDKQGYWKWFYPNGKTEFLAKYTDDDKDSTVTLYAPDGAVRIKFKYNFGELLSYTYEGKDGKDVTDIMLPNESGKVVGYYANGQKSFEVTYKNGWREGKCSYYYFDGKLQWEENYVKGNKVGKQTFYWADGKLQKEVNQYYDELDGPSKYYDKAGNLTKEENYSMGFLNGEVKDYEAGKVKKKTDYYYGVEL